MEGKTEQPQKYPPDVKVHLKDKKEGDDELPVHSKEPDVGKKHPLQGQMVGGADDEASLASSSLSDSHKPKTALASAAIAFIAKSASGGSSGSGKDGDEQVDETATNANSRGDSHSNSQGEHKEKNGGELDAAKRKEEIKMLLKWLKKHCPDIGQTHMENYCDIFYREHITSATRLGRKIVKEPECLLEWGVHEVDAEDIMLALHEAELTKPTELPPASPGSPGKQPQEKEGEGGEGDQPSRSHNINETPISNLARSLGLGARGVIDYYMPEGADEYVHMVPIVKSSRHVWGPEVVGLCAMIYGGGLEKEGFHDVDVWIYGRILSHDANKKVHIFVASDGMLFEMDLDAYKIRLEISSHTMRRSSRPKAKPEKMVRRFFYPEIGSVEDPRCVIIGEERMKRELEALDKQLEMCEYMVRGLGNRMGESISLLMDSGGGAGDMDLEDVSEGDDSEQEEDEEAELRRLEAEAQAELEKRRQAELDVERKKREKRERELEHERALEIEKAKAIAQEEAIEAQKKKDRSDEINKERRKIQADDDREKDKVRKAKMEKEMELKKAREEEELQRARVEWQKEKERRRLEKEEKEKFGSPAQQAAGNSGQLAQQAAIMAAKRQERDDGARPPPPGGSSPRSPRPPPGPPPR